MHSFARRLALALVLLGSAFAVHAQVVISQVYGGGGNSGAPLKSDFIELHNNGTASVSLAGWSVQYASATGTGAWTVTTLSGSIAPGAYYLVKQADGAGAQPALPTPDATGTIAMSGTAGKVALSNSTAAFSGVCPAGNIDLVGYGPTANCAETSPTGALSNTTAALRGNSGCTDTGNNTADFTVVAPAPRNSATAAFACAGAAQPTLSIADLTIDEGDSGTKIATFTVQLSSPAGAGGVTFDIATADDTATTANNDYVANALLAQTIAAGNTSYTFSVTVNGDTAAEPNESFLVNVTNVSGALVGDGVARATIVSDDFAIVAIHDIQGAGATSPINGQTVITLGIVTGRKSNGFFLQSADNEVDGNTATSQGIFVFTSAAPPVQAAVGNRVRVTGTVDEFIPSADPNQLPFTELKNATVIELSTGNAMPAPMLLTATFPNPANPALDQLEPVEAMRVTAASFTVAAPTGGNTSEPNATGSTNGIFSIVVSGVPRPMREPGIQNPDAPPAGSSIPPIPRWDFNPELLTVVSRGIGGPALDFAAGTQLGNLVGPLDYGFRRYTIVPDPSVTIAVSAVPSPTAARLPVADELTVASYNLERFFDTIADPGTDDPVLTPAAYANRLNKASLAIRNFLNTPDILGVVEVEKLPVLQDVAAKVNGDAVAAGQPNPEYFAYLEEGNDIGGIDVGFLVKQADVAAGIDRVEVVAVTQQGKTTPLTNPDGSTDLLNDRPPLQLEAVVHYADGRSFPITVIVVHQRSLNGNDQDSATGLRVRNKRQKQAEYLANLVQGLQTADAQRRISVVGDFNAFEFNDGYVDAMNVLGTPSADPTTVVPGDGADIVNPDLLNLFSEEPVDQRYSFVFDGNAQSLDHVVANQALLLATDDFGLDHARINADFPEVSRNDANSPTRLSDHDPAIAYYRAPGLPADLVASASAMPSTVEVGAQMTFNAGIANQGPGTADMPAIGIAFDAVLPDLAVTPPAGWTCGAPVISSGMTSLACSTATLANAGAANVQLSATAPADEAGNTIRMAVSVDSQTDDPNAANNTAEASVAVAARVDLTVQLDTASQSVRAGGMVNFQIPVSSLGPDAAPNAVLVVRANIPGGNASISPPSSVWQCVRVIMVTYEARCTRNAAMPVGAIERFSLTTIMPSRSAPASLNVSAVVSSSAADRTPANNTASRQIPRL